MISLSFDYTAFIAMFIVGVFCWLFFWKNNNISPSLFFSDVKDLKRAGLFAENWQKVPDFLKVLALIFLALAFVNPYYIIENKRDRGRLEVTPVEGIAIYLVLDKSGSMAEEMTRTGLGGKREIVSKMDLMKSVSQDFVKGRPSDMIGVVSFARQADVDTPLTLDHQYVDSVLRRVKRVEDKEMDGTAIGYAIYKTANLITATKQYGKDALGGSAYTIKEGVIVLLTDGFQDPSALDYGNKRRTIGVEEAAAYAKEQGVKLYTINIDPKVNTSQFSPHRRLMQRSAELTGGKFYQVDNGQSLESIYKEINQIEKSSLPGGFSSLYDYKRIEFYPYLIAAAMIALFSSILLSTTLARRIP